MLDATRLTLQWGRDQIELMEPRSDEGPVAKFLLDGRNGVLSPVPGAIGALMAVEALKYLAGIESRRGILRLFDAVSGEFRAVAVKKRSDCPACSL